jgi:transglutaminase-like putative cysteine protease
VAAQRLEQRFHYTYASPIRDLRHRLLTIPPRRHGRQVRVEHGVHVVGDPVLVSTSRDAFGNHVVDVRAAVVREWIELRSWSVVSFEGDGREGPSATPAMAARFLEPTTLTAAGPRILEAAQAERSAAGADDVELAERLCAWTHRSLRYEYGITKVSTTADEALAGGVGVCQDSAHVMLAACRRAGLAARYVSGHLVGEGGSHAWVEVLVPVSGRRGVGGRFEAIAFDPTHDRRVVDGSGYVTVAVGRDYVDVAPTSGSFAGRCSGVLAASKVLKPVPA